MIRFLLASVAASAATAAAAPPNILFILTDQQHADALSCRMGDQHLRTPAMDSLAARGTFFTRAYAANPLCMPSRNSIFTGRFPHETGVTDNTPMRTGMTLDPAAFPTMGTCFQRAGFRTGYFGKWHLCYDPSSVETHGFSAIDTQQKDAVTAERVIGFLREKDARPFLVVASFLNPHNVAELSRGQPLSNGPIGDPPALDRLPPPPANLAPPAFEPDTMALIRRGYHANERLFPVGHFSPAMWQALRWGYYRLVEKVDAEIGRVLAALRETGLDRNTLIVFVSDHGECAGAHGLTQKTVFYEESVRVPLIICPPGQIDARVSEAFVNVGVDLLPTLLDYAAIGGAPSLRGRSLRALAAGETVADWRDAIISQNHMSQGGPVDGFVPVTEGRMVRTERFKYCVYAHGERRESLVDMLHDPGEMVDLASDPAYRGIVLEHRKRLQRFGEEFNDPLVRVLLADDVAPRPFEQNAPTNRTSGRAVGAPAATSN